MATITIESYDLYHIGNKLNPAINYEKMEGELRENLKNAGFTITENEIITNVRTAPSEVIAIKNDVRLEINYVAQAINLIGTEPSTVTSVFGELLSTLTKMEYDIESTIIFFEVIASITLKSEDKPFEKIGESIGLNPNLFAESNLPVVNTIGLRIGGKNSSEKTSIVLTIEPSPVNPALKTVVRVHYRAEKENILNFYHTLENNILELFEKL